MKNKKLKSDEKTIVFVLFSLHFFWNIDMICMNRVEVVMWIMDEFECWGGGVGG